MAFRGLLVAAAALALAAPARAERLSVLDNGTVRVGVDLDQGGKITWLSRSSGDDVRNLVFEDEQSYYAGGGWHGYQDPARVVVESNDGRTIYMRAVSVDCECALSTWTTLRGDTVSVRNRLESHRLDTTAYPASWQELPALYTQGGLCRLVTYDGAAPYTDGALDEFTAADGGKFFVSPGPGFDATEHWAALVDDRDFGVGLFEPDAIRFAGVAGSPYGFPSGYLTATRLEQLDANVVYDYSYTLVVGSLDRIRAYAVAHRPDGRPRYLFRRDREHFVVVNAADAGFPIEGALRVHLDEDDPQLVGPETRFASARVPRLYIRAAWHTTERRAQLFWGAPGGGYPFSELRSLHFPVVADGRFHTYRIELADLGTWYGPVTGLRLDPVDDAQPGGWVDLTCISWRPCPVDRRAERALLASPELPLLDRFDRLDGSFWSINGNSAETSVAVSDGELEIDVPAATKPLPGQDFVSAGVNTRCSLAGDFETQVDYRLLDWPSANGVNVNFSVANRTLFRHNSSFGDDVSSYFPPYPDGRVGADQLSGSLRFVRAGGIVSGFVLDATGSWLRLNDAPIAAGPVPVSLSIFTNPSGFAHEDVRVAFDNFRILRGRLVCP
jgi:hypothetical protein